MPRLTSVIKRDVTECWIDAKLMSIYRLRLEYNYINESITKP